MTEFVLQAKNIVKVYREGERDVAVLRDVDVAVSPREMVAIVGASGSGKSTLLHILGLLDSPDTGTVNVAGVANAQALSEGRKSALRNQHLGFVYQFHHLLAEFTALENVAMPLTVRRLDRRAASEQAMAVLEQVGLADRASHLPSQLSGGERQRVALARALVTKPACVLADEPTGSLDRNTAYSMYELLQRLNREAGTAFVIVTHDHELAALASRQLVMEKGRLVTS